jgi:hypothetical protein
MKRNVSTHRESLATRRKLAGELHKLSTGRRFKPAERAELARMADAWAATLPKKNSIN